MTAAGENPKFEDT